MVIGLTGLPASGKSTAAQILHQNGAHVIDVDKLGHRALRAPDIKQKVCSIFGSDILDDSGEINRAKLGTIVFGNPAQLKKLESTVHPWMCNEVREEIEATPTDVVIDAALLCQMRLNTLCDKIIFVNATMQTRLERALQRGWDEKELQQRQKRLDDIEYNNDPKTVFIDNDESFERLEKKLLQLWKDIKK